MKSKKKAFDTRLERINQHSEIMGTFAISIEIKSFFILLSKRCAVLCLCRTRHVTYMYITKKERLLNLWKISSGELNPCNSCAHSLR